MSLRNSSAGVASSRRKTRGCIAVARPPKRRTRTERGTNYMVIIKRETWEKQEREKTNKEKIKEERKERMDGEAKRQSPGGSSGGGWTPALDHFHRLI